MPELALRQLQKLRELGCPRARAISAISAIRSFSDDSAYDMSRRMADDDELERQREIALGDVTWKATLVAGNMLPVIAGAGHPHSLA